ncbi:MAG: hypothetical protein WC606_04175 [Candidatus Absconditabacterales bacterium]
MKKTKNKKIYWRGFKGPQTDYFKQKKKIRRKVIALIIGLPILFLIEIVCLQLPLQEYWPPLLCIFAFFGALPFMIGALQTMHLSYKLSATISSTIFIWIVVMIVMFSNQAPSPGMRYVTDKEIFCFVGINAIKTILIGSLITLIGHSIKKVWINTKSMPNKFQGGGMSLLFLYKKKYKQSKLH